MELIAQGLLTDMSRPRQPYCNYPPAKIDLPGLVARVEELERLLKIYLDNDQVLSVGRERQPTGAENQSDKNEH